MSKQRLIRYREKIEYLDETIRNLEDWTQEIESNYFVDILDLQKKYGIYHAFQIAVEIV